MNKIIFIVANLLILSIASNLQRQAIWIQYSIPDDYKTNQNQLLNPPYQLLNNALKEKGLVLIGINDAEARGPYLKLTFGYVYQGDMAFMGTAIIDNFRTNQQLKLNSLELQHEQHFSNLEYSVPGNWQDIDLNSNTVNSPFMRAYILLANNLEQQGLGLLRITNAQQKQETSGFSIQMSFSYKALNPHTNPIGFQEKNGNVKTSHMSWNLPQNNQIDNLNLDA